jgi:hypothetical protein
LNCCPGSNFIHIRSRVFGESRPCVFHSGVRPHVFSLSGILHFSKISIGLPATFLFSLGPDQTGRAITVRAAHHGVLASA